MNYEEKEKKRKMKSRIIWGVVGFFMLVVFMNGCSSYNAMVEYEEEVDGAWSQVENVYQRRMDLIPNLVETVKGFAAHEKETLEGVIQARANATKITIDPSNMTDEQLSKFDKHQTELSSALSKLMMVSEQYPNLKANENFMSLQAELAGTENRIAVERKNFIEAVKAYNKKIRKFPRNIWAGMFGFEKKPNFEAQTGADTAPKVQF